MFNPFNSSERSLIPNRQIFLEPAQQLSQARDLRLDGPSPKCLDIETCWKSIHHSPNFVKRHIEARKLETVWRKCFLQIILKFKNRRGPCTKSWMPNCKLSNWSSNSLYSILLKASHDELVHELVTLHNHKLIPRLMTIMRSQLKNERGNFFLPTRIFYLYFCFIGKCLKDF